MNRYSRDMNPVCATLIAIYLSVCLNGTTVWAIDGEALPGEQVYVVRVPHEHVHPQTMPGFDPCSLDPEGAVMFLTQAEINEMNAPTEIVSTLEDYVRAYLPLKTIAAVGVPSIEKLLGDEARGPDPVDRPTESDGGITPGEGGGIEYDRYHTYAEGLAFLNNLTSANPNIARLVNIGQSVEGRIIWALKITDNPNLDEPDEQTAFYCGVHHAREWATFEMMLYLADRLINDYATDLRVQNIVDNAEIWLVPVVNPDGFVYSWEESRMWRKNRRLNANGGFGVDINRNYAFNWGYDNQGSSPGMNSGTYRGTEPASEPETQAIQNLLMTERPAVAVSLHTYSQLVLYPWGYTSRITAQAYTSLRGIGDAYVKKAGRRHGFDYVAGPNNYTIYPTNGDFNDFAYGTAGALSFTPELRPASSSLGGFLLPEEQILPNNQENYEAALWILENVADARTIVVPNSEIFGPGTNMFSVPQTPVSIQPEQAFGMTQDAFDSLSAYIFRDPEDVIVGPYFGEYPSQFEGMGSGSAYQFEYDELPGPWVDEFTSMTILPYVLEDGARVMLENTENIGLNIVGVPYDEPLRMSKIKVYKRIVTPVGSNNFGYREVVLESRNAFADLISPEPWLDWSWDYTASNGTVETAFPGGGEGLSEFLTPFRAYEFVNNMPSSNFASTDETNPVYVLAFPAPIRGDINDDGIVAMDDYTAFVGCLTGPIQQMLPIECELFDFNRDRDIDLDDAEVFWRNFGLQE